VGETLGSKEEKLHQAAHLGQLGGTGLGRRGVSRGLENPGLRGLGTWVLMGFGMKLCF